MKKLKLLLMAAFFAISSSSSNSFALKNDELIYENYYYAPVMPNYVNVTSNLSPTFFISTTPLQNLSPEIIPAVASAQNLPIAKDKKPKKTRTIIIDGKEVEVLRLIPENMQYFRNFYYFEKINHINEWLDSIKK